MQLSPNTQSILLLTAPLLGGRQRQSAKPLTPTEYRRIRRFLLERGLEPAHLINPHSVEVLNDPLQPVDKGRLENLLARGFLLSQAVERWAKMGIWVMSLADAGYPSKFKQRLHESSPPVIYGCGQLDALESSGLAVVGSRDTSEEIVSYATQIGHIAAIAGTTIISGGARGVDQAAMRGALDSDGRTIGILADGLEQSALNRDNRNHLIDGRLTLISTCDPSTTFNTGLRMQRNKFIYALSEAAVVVSSNHGKGGTWAGAVEQLDKLKFVPVYVRCKGEPSRGLEALEGKGALRWPEPNTPEAFLKTLLMTETSVESYPAQLGLFRADARNKSDTDNVHNDGNPSTVTNEFHTSQADELFSAVREILGKGEGFITEGEVATELEIPRTQARRWLDRLVKEGLWEKLRRPARYRRMS